LDDGVDATSGYLDRRNVCVAANCGMISTETVAELEARRPEVVVPP
jgi:hypothetical protein